MDKQNHNNIFVPYTLDTQQKNYKLQIMYLQQKHKDFFLTKETGFLRLVTESNILIKNFAIALIICLYSSSLD